MKPRSFAKLIALTFLASTLSIATCIHAMATPGYTVADYDSAVVKAADRLIETQNNDGTWEWMNPDLNPDNGPGPLNIVGVTALGLSDAYELTSNSTYLDASIVSATFIKENLYKEIARGNPAYPDLTSFDLNFLIKLSDATGNDTYKTWATEDWEWRKANDTTNQYFGYGNQSAIVSTLIAWGESAFGSGLGDGLAAWECGKLILAATELGDTNWAGEMADEITKTNGVLANLTTADGQWPIAGLTLKALQKLDPTTYASDIVTLETLLQNNQNGDGSFGTGNDVVELTQNTAYAIMGLVSVGKLDDARNASDWLVANQDANGGWVYSAVEITEIDSEAIQGLKTTADAACISQGDLNLDRIVDIVDIRIVAKAFGSTPSDPNWDPIADLNNDGLIDIFDMRWAAKNYSKTPT